MKAVRTLIFWIHLTLGCVAGLVILAMSVTGILLAFERQINGWADTPAILQGQSDSPRQASLDSMGAQTRGVFIAGTDTEVGKTYVTTALVRALVRAGQRVGVMNLV